MLQRVEEAKINLRSVTVIRNGYIVLEAYNQPFTADRWMQVHSVTKSVMGALTGIAIGEGYIRGVDESVLSFFPEHTAANLDSRKEAITVEDLLTMQPGLDCADQTLGQSVENSRDWVQYTLDLPMASPPGEQMIYCTAGVHLLSAIVSRATLTPTGAYAQSRLFTPLGISRDDIVWASDPQGMTIGGYGIAMKPRDMAKLGLLYLYDGRWGEQQIVPAEWVAASSRVQAVGGNQKDYGYLFWVYPSHFAAEGMGEQKVMVVKDRDMVVVMTAAIDWTKGAPLEELLRDYIIPAAKSDGPLPANPAAYEELQARVKFLANPVRPVEPLPEIASNLTGRVFVPESNPFGWKTLTLHLEEGSSEAKVSVLDGARQTDLAIGMDNVYRRTDIGGKATWARGHWEGDSVLVVRQLQWIPDLEETEYRLDFSGDDLKIHVEEVVFGYYTFDIKATAR
jgi:CubicO group peptidase (beta-lactamase class C family)